MFTSGRCNRPMGAWLNDFCHAHADALMLYVFCFPSLQLSAVSVSCAEIRAVGVDHRWRLTCSHSQRILPSRLMHFIFCCKYSHAIYAASVRDQSSSNAWELPALRLSCSCQVPSDTCFIFFLQLKINLSPWLLQEIWVAETMNTTNLFKGMNRRFAPSGSGCVF
jgi:hypothetical protein